MERKILAGIIGIAFAARAIAIWITRPEFVGWFNHSYYYWVQVQGVLESSQLPFADLPLLFYFYAAVASVFQLFGMELQPAIVNATRMIMSVAPALIAYPFYLIVRRINLCQPLVLRQWALVTVSAFLPLTFAHMPELLQKNTLGLLLLSGLMYAIYASLEERSPKRWLGVSLLLILILLTHLGTLAATLLFGVSVLLAFVYDNSSWRRVLAIMLLAAALTAGCLAVIYVLDAGAFSRILRYAQSSLTDSLAGRLFSAEPVSFKSLFLLGILLPLVFMYFLVTTYKKHRHSLQYGDRLFWLGNVFAVYLLVLPVIDLQIVPRLILFMPMPLLVVVNYHLKYHEGQRANRLLVSLASLGAAVMLLGDAQNIFRLYPDKDEIHAELMDLRERIRFSENDFVLTNYGVNPVCNWFLGSKSGLITAFNTNDRASYDRLFVLNTAEISRPGAGENPEKDRHTFLTEKEKYAAMRQSIPLPADAKPLGLYRHLEIYELLELPGNWLIDTEGNWIGWVAQRD
jgi:hypothetical protein